MVNQNSSNNKNGPPKLSKPSNSNTIQKKALRSSLSLQEIANSNAIILFPFKAMVLILDGNSGTGEHMQSEIGTLIFLSHFCRLQSQI